MLKLDIYYKIVCTLLLSLISLVLVCRLISNWLVTPDLLAVFLEFRLTLLLMSLGHQFEVGTSFSAQTILEDSPSFSYILSSSVLMIVFVIVTKVTICFYCHPIFDCLLALAGQLACSSQSSSASHLQQVTLLGIYNSWHALQT